MSSANLDPVRFSRLKLMAKSAAHFEAGYGAETGPMRKGSALHAYLLGGSEKVSVFRDGIRNKKSAKWIDFQAEHQGKHILIPSELAAVEGMRRSVERHQRAMDLLDDGVQETRITWDLGGRACAGTPDVVKPGKGRKRLVELKSCDTSAPDLFRWKGKRMGYPAQVSWYADGLERCLNYTPGAVDEAYVVAVESTAPYPVTVFHMAESILAAGRRQWRVWFEALRNCEQSGSFPPYAQSDVEWEDEDGFGLEWGDAAE
jgi:PDDEXK-like domain of unknown function (DUF3799)